MRPRFSLRTLLTATTLLAIAIYFLFVRPTTLAKAFADRVAAKKYLEDKLLCHGTMQSLLVARAEDLENYDVKVKLERRRWSDILRCQQRMTIEACRLVPISGTNKYVALRGDFLAGPISIQPPDLIYPITVQR